MKKNLFLLAAIIVTCSMSYAQINVKTIVDQVTKTTGGGGGKLSNEEVVKGLREALTVGTNNSTSKASQLNGFYGNSLIKIPFPPEAKQMESTLKQIGMTKQVNEFVLNLNRAAENAAKDAAPIFINAIKSMSIADGFSILKGGDNAATKYLQDKTIAQLKAQFMPVIRASLQKVQITKYWKPMVTKYNKVPGVKKQNPNLDDYVTTRAIEGLFKLIAAEELKIRKDPAARVSDILKKVFG